MLGEQFGYAGQTVWVCWANSLGMLGEQFGVEYGEPSTPFLLNLRIYSECDVWAAAAAGDLEHQVIGVCHVRILRHAYLEYKCQN